MPTEPVQTTREFIYVGWFSTNQLIVAGIVLFVLIGLLAWRESRTVSWKLLPVLVCLRLGAVIVTLWLLAAPTIRTKITHTKMKSVGMLVDTSASMGVVDPPNDPGAATRWAAAQTASQSPAPIRNCDGAAVNMSVAVEQFVRFAKACQTNARSTLVRQYAEGTQRAIEAAVEHLQQAAARTPSPHSNHLREVSAALRESLLRTFSALCEDIQAGRLSLLQDRTRRLGEMAEELFAAETKVRRLADDLAASYSERADREMLGRIRAQTDMSRIQRTVAFLETGQDSWLKDIERQARVIRYLFDSSVQAVRKKQWSSVLPTADETKKLSTDLTCAMEQILQDSAGGSMQGVMLFTDGAHNASSDPRRLASGLFDLPMYIVPIGNTQIMRDVMLHHVQAPRTVFQNDRIVIEGTIDAYGCTGEELVLELLKDGETVDTRKIEVLEDIFVQRAAFTQKAEQMGSQEFRLRVKTIPDEKITENNEAELRVEVIEGEIRVLLADRVPRWEYRYLRNLFDRDDRIEMDTLLFEPRRLNSPAPAEGRGLPRNLDEWSRYRVVILGDLLPSQLTPTQQDLLEQYVSHRGGTLVVIAGKDAMPAKYTREKFQRMIPVTWAGAVPRSAGGVRTVLTSEGQSLWALQLSDDPLTNKRIWGDMGGRLPIYGLSPYSSPKPTSHVLIAASPQYAVEGLSQQKRAFLCWGYYGSGRVVYLSAPVSYQLRFRGGDRYHHRFWGQLLRWAVARDMAGGSKTIRLVTDKMRYNHGETVQVTVDLNRVNGEPVRREDLRTVARDKSQIVAMTEMVEDESIPGRYRGVLKELPTGRFSIQIAGAAVLRLLVEEEYSGVVETAVTVDPEDTLELRDTRCNLPLLSQIAQSTGGLVLPPTGLPAALSQLDLSPEVSQTVADRPLWTRWAYLWMFLGFLTVEWIIRKLSGLN